MNIIIDGANLANTAWFGSPLKSFRDYPDNNQNDAEIERALLLDFLHRLTNIVDNITLNQEESNTIICWDSAASVRMRREVFPAYKRNRSKDRKDRKEHVYPIMFIDRIIPKLREVHNKFGVQYKLAEADDLIALLCTLLSASNNYVVTTDQDMYQIITSTTKLYNHRTSQIIDKRFIKGKLAITPEQITLYKALCGDTSDNYPGLRGVGTKTAIKHIKANSVFGAEDSAKIAMFKELATIPYPRLKIAKILHLLDGLDFDAPPEWDKLKQDVNITEYDTETMRMSSLS